MYVALRATGEWKSSLELRHADLDFIREIREPSRQ
jgi:hypothetical protein